MPDARSLLIRQLQGAYSGELAAAHAYRGHAASVRRADEAQRIRAIEAEEEHHRALVGELLATLGAAPHPRLERVLGLIGRTLGALCHVTGWFAPMYGAGRLESHNIKEYEDAAEYALECGEISMIECLLTMAEVEWEHEKYFRERVSTHWLSRVIPMWKQPPPRDSIRARFADRLPALTPSAAAAR